MGSSRTQCSGYTATGFASLFLAVYSFPVQARLGETVDECINRYGQPISQTQVALGTNVHFIFKGVPIYAIFANGLCEVITFMGVSPELMTALLDANAGQFKWGEPYTKTLGDGFALLLWDRKDGARAEYDPRLRVMQFRSPTIRKQDRQQEKSAVSGF